MARQESNRAAEMAVFAEVVEAGGFTAAALRLDMTPSAVSKLISRLETRLGTRLLNRSTRQLQPTVEGKAFHAQCLRILDEIEQAEREVSSSALEPRGRLRINCFVPFAALYLLPILPEFLERYPGITVDVASTDAVVDLMQDRTDIAIRAGGTLPESSHVARKLGEGRMVIVASPAYLERHGTPRTPGELAQHNLLAFNFAREIPHWPLLDGRGGTRLVRPAGNALMGDGESMRQVVLSGLGVARLSRMHTRHDIEAGRLVPLLEDYNPGDLEAVHAIYLGPGKHVPPRVRVMLDFLLEKISFA